MLACGFCHLLCLSSADYFTARQHRPSNFSSSFILRPPCALPSPSHSLALPRSLSQGAATGASVPLLATSSAGVAVGVAGGTAATPVLPQLMATENDVMAAAYEGLQTLCLMAESPLMAAFAGFWIRSQREGVHPSGACGETMRDAVQHGASRGAERARGVRERTSAKCAQGAGRGGGGGGGGSEDRCHANRQERAPVDAAQNSGRLGTLFPVPFPPLLPPSLPTAHARKCSQADFFPLLIALPPLPFCFGVCAPLSATRRNASSGALSSRWPCRSHAWWPPR